MSNIRFCVACSSENWQVVEEHKGFQLATCKDCGLTFTLNPDYKPERYKAAYVGQGDIPVAEEHSYVYESPAKRLWLEAQLFEFSIVSLHLRSHWLFIGVLNYE